MVTNYVNISDIDSSVVEKPKKQKKTSTPKKQKSGKKTSKKEDTKVEKTVEQQLTRDQFKTDLKNKIKEQVKDMVYQLNQSSATTVIYEKEKPVNYQFEYTVEMIDWNEPESASWDYNSMGNLGWELCNVELNTRTNFTTATFKREIHEDSLYRKFEYTVKTRYWSNKLDSDVWTYEEMGKEHWQLCHILDDSESETTEYYFMREIFEDAEK